MSYILEALKKAQAERQLGNAPTIHAPAPGYTAPVTRASRRPLVAGAAAGAIVLALGAAVYLWRQPAAPSQVASAPAATTVPAPAVVPAPQPAALPTPLPPAPPEPQAKPKAETAPAARPKEAAKPVTPPYIEAAETPPPEPARPVVMAAPTTAPPPVEDNVGPLQSLPEAIQRDVPKVVFGGYIYSPNPAERLLLVDKMLRREGEEVAPGLVLERLLPKAAIMNFRGYRYRVAY